MRETRKKNPDHSEILVLLRAASETGRYDHHCWCGQNKKKQFRVVASRRRLWQGRSGGSRASVESGHSWPDWSTGQFLIPHFIVLFLCVI